MKAIFYITALIFLFTFNFGFSQNSPHCSEDMYSFQPGEQVYIFGNNVKLRSAPRIESDVLGLLKIGEWVKVIEKTEFSWPYKGYDAPFYKVKYDTQEGYILGSLLSLERKTIAGNHYFFAFSKEKNSPFLNIRHVVRGKYTEQKVPLSHTSLSIHVLGNRGILDVDNILYVDYHAHSCSNEDGGIYFFVQKNRLHKIGELSQISDSGLLYQSEKFIFPDDEYGIPGMILFKKEKGEILDEETDWVQTTIETRKFLWVEDKLVPDFRQKRPY
ncbi:SH3 domain-containing protein [Flagellimonas sp. S174]|uniref:SH3 domain-containing protein n=1 Tax=Flagellimonas sp. S174 TaxID=3410790 RepID=UPI003BF4C63A